MISVCVAGATGWTGRQVAVAVVEASDLTLTSAVARSAAGSDLGVAWGTDPIGIPVREKVVDALEGVDVLVDYTTHDSVREHTLAAIQRGVAVVVGASGLSAADYEEIDECARANEVGVIAAGNFSLTATLAHMAAAMAATHLRHWEIIDYASATKPDAPSGTSREMAERLASVASPHARSLSVVESAGPPEARGASIAGTRIHSVRLPGYSLSTEVIFGHGSERLVIRHDNGTDAGQYVDGTLLAIRAAQSIIGLHRGLDAFL